MAEPETQTEPTEPELEQAEQNIPDPPDEDRPDPDEDPADEAKREAIKYRRKLRAAEQANDELRSDNERLRQQVAEHEVRAGDSVWRAAYIAAEVELAASRAGAKRPGIVTKLVPTEPLKELETVEAIRTGCEAAVQEVLQSAPELKGVSGQRRLAFPRAMARHELAQSGGGRRCPYPQWRDGVHEAQDRQVARHAEVAALAEHLHLGR